MKIVPKNWTGFQHYKNRRPPWIKLYRTLLDDVEFHCLPDASKALAIMLWLLASESETGEITADHKALAFRLRTTPAKIKDALNPLISEGFFFDSEMLAGCLHDAIPERERETYKEEGETDGTPAKKLPSCPVDKVVQLYHEILPELPKVMEVTQKRKDAIRDRWKQIAPESEDEGLSDFKDYFSLVRSSDFLMGRKEPTNGHKRFFATLEWLVNPDKFVKVCERNYHERV